MYHGLRKALTTGVGRSSKDGRVTKVEESFTRLQKGILSLQWAIDNCESTWTAQSSFCKYLPAIAGDIYARDDVAARSAVAAAQEAAAALAASTASAQLAPVKSELSTLLARVKKLEQRKTEWTKTVSDKAYYDDKHAKIVAAIEKTDAAPTARETERRKKALTKKTQVADDLNRLTKDLQAEFDAVASERLHLADKVFLAVFAAQSANARCADLAAVHAQLVSARFGSRDVPVPARDAALTAVLTGVDPPKRRSSVSSDTTSSPPPQLHQHLQPQRTSPPPPPPPHSTSPQRVASPSLLPAPAPPPCSYVPYASAPPPTGPLPAPPPVVASAPAAPLARPDARAQYPGPHAWPQHARSADSKLAAGVGGLAIGGGSQHVRTGFSPSAPPPPPTVLDPLFQSFDAGSVDVQFFPRSNG